MLTCASRSLLIVNDETPISYLPRADAGDDRVERRGLELRLEAQLLRDRLKRSTSKPSIVLPSAARNSLGA